MSGILKGLGSRAIIGAFYKRLEEVAAATWVAMLASRFNTDQPSETYQLLGDSPAMKEWLGPRKAKNLKDFDFEVKNRKFTNGIEVDEDDFRRDKTGQILVRIREMGARAAVLPQRLITDVITSNAVAYDGVAMFSNSHVNLNGDAIDNTVDQTAANGTTPTNQEMEDGLLASVERMLGFLDDEGEPRNEFASQFMLMVPPALWKQAQGAIKNDLRASGESNTLKNTGYDIMPVMNARLTNSAKCYLFRTDADVRPFVWQDEVPTTMSALVEGSDFHTLNDKRAYFAKRICAAAPGRFDQSIELTFT